MALQPFGKALAKEFLFDPSYRNLNHGSFGCIPRAIQQKQREYQDRAEARPDPFIRYEYDALLDESRVAVAELLRVPTDTVVFVSNATLGVNTILRNIEWATDGRDEILYFDTIYGACGRSIDYVVDTARGLVSSRRVKLAYPLEDADAVALLRAAARASRAAGRRPRLCVLDVVSSQPGVRFPFEAAAAACRAEGVLSLVDGAQGIGMVDLDLGAADPDFFVSNCHKWLHAPRGCAVLYVPLRNQAAVRSTLPTSHGYAPRSGRPAQPNPLPPSGGRSPFVANFAFVGTLDNAPYLCVRDAIKWRRDVLGGEERIRAYTTGLARDGGKRVAEMLGTEVLDNEAGTLTACAMVNVALPLPPAGRGPEAERLAADITRWMEQTVMREFDTFIVIYMYRGRWWVRLSAQVYLDIDDFEFAGRVLKEICRRVERKEHLKAVSKL